MANYQITERVDLGEPHGLIDPHQIGGSVVIRLPKAQGDRLVDVMKVALRTKAAVTYPKVEEPEPKAGGSDKEDPKGDSKEGGKGEPKGGDKK